MQLKTIDLVAISEAAKALKQKDFIYYNGNLYGLDNIEGYLIYMDISNYISPEFFNLNGIAFNARELSAFMKTILSEEEFDITFINGVCVINTMMDGILTIKYLPRFINTINNKIKVLSYQSTIPMDVTDNLLPLFSMKKTDGCFYYKPLINNQKLFITLFPGLLPLNKSDKILLSVALFDISFIAYFTVIKKKFKVNIVVYYLKV